MADETLLVALLGGLHLLGFALMAVLLLPCLRDESIRGLAQQPGEEEDGGGGGGSDRRFPIAPRGPRPGGIPLPDAVPARVRLRDERRLSDLLPRLARRPAREPARPRHVPLRGGDASGTY